MQKIRNFIKWWNRPNKSMFADYAQSLILIIPIAFMIRTWGYGLYRVPSGSMETTLLVGEMFFADKFTYIFSKPKRGDIISFNEPIYSYSDNKVKRLWEQYVWGPENWTKRVVGLPGDHIEGKIEDGHPVVYVNGVKFDEPYVNKYPLVPVELRRQNFKSYDPSRPFNDQPFYDMNPLIVKQAQRMLKEMGKPTERIPGTPINGIITGSDIYDVQLDDHHYWVMGDNRLGSWDCRGWGALDGNLIHGKIVFRIFSVDTTADWLILDILLHPITFWKRFRWSRCLQKVS